MAEWKGYKNVPRMYKDDGDNLRFAYYNYTYSRQTVSLVNMLFGEILKDFSIFKDFSEEIVDDIHIRMLPTFPYEVVLEFSFPKYDLEHVDLSQFEKMPNDFCKL